MVHAQRRSRPSSSAKRLAIRLSQFEPQGARPCREWVVERHENRDVSIGRVASHLKLARFFLLWWFHELCIVVAVFKI
jgi:hypothetical protein